MTSRLVELEAIAKLIEQTATAPDATKEDMCYAANMWNHFEQRNFSRTTFSGQLPAWPTG